MQKLLHAIENCDFSIKQLQEIAKIMSENLKELPVSEMIIPAGRHIYRVRKHNEPNNFTPHLWQDELSYRKDEDNIHSFGRCNTPYQSHFYGSIVTKDLENGTPAIDEGYVTSIFETTSMYDSSDETVDTEGYERYTLGMWRITKPIKLVVVPPLDFENQLSTLSIELRKRFNRLIENIPLTDDQLKLYQIMSREFSKEMLKKPNSHYGISALISSVVLNSTQGIAYPSVKTLQQSMNVVLNKETTDNCLQLRKAGVIELFKLKKDYYFRNNLLAECTPKKMIHYQPVQKDQTVTLKEVKDYFTSRGIGLDYINSILSGFNIPE